MWRFCGPSDFGYVGFRVGAYRGMYGDSIGFKASGV